MTVLFILLFLTTIHHNKNRKLFSFLPYNSNILYTFCSICECSSLMYRKAITTIDDSEENISTKMNGTKEIWIFIDIQRECLILFNWLQFTVSELIFFPVTYFSLENFQIISSCLSIDFIYCKLDWSIIFNTQKQVEVKSQIWKSNHQPWFWEKPFQAG